MDVREVMTPDVVVASPDDTLQHAAEMMIDIDRMLILLDAAQSTGLPVWVGFTCEPDAQGVVCLRNGEPLCDALAVIEDRQIDLVNIMHTEVEYIDASLDVVQSNWSSTAW